MISNEIKRKLQDIVRGASLQGSSDHCSTIRSLLIEGFGADPTVKGQFESRAVIKEKQTIFLKSYALQSEIWLSSEHKSFSPFDFYDTGLTFHKWRYPSSYNALPKLILNRYSVCPNLLL